MEKTLLKQTAVLVFFFFFGGGGGGGGAPLLPCYQLSPGNQLPPDIIQLHITFQIVAFKCSK